VATVWGAVDAWRGSEVFQQQQVETELRSRVRIRWRSDVKPQYRLTWNARTFLIRAVEDVEDRRRELHLIVEEVAA
jgi:SPP1 family predicted phage head-tail adaptor